MKRVNEREMTRLTSHILSGWGYVVLDGNLCESREW